MLEQDAPVRRNPSLAAIGKLFRTCATPLGAANIRQGRGSTLRCRCCRGRLSPIPFSFDALFEVLQKDGVPRYETTRGSVNDQTGILLTFVDTPQSELQELFPLVYWYGTSQESAPYLRGGEVGEQQPVHGPFLCPCEQLAAARNNAQRHDPAIKSCLKLLLPHHVSANDLMMIVEAKKGNRGVFSGRSRRPYEVASCNDIRFVGGRLRKVLGTFY